MEAGDMIAQRLEALIEQRGMKPTAVSLQAGMSRTGVRDIITRKTKNPKFETLRRLADVIGVDVSEITGETSAQMDIEIIEPHQSVPIGAEFVSVYDVEVAAGAGALTEYEAISARLVFPPNYLDHITTTPRDQLAIVTVIGNSMSPTLHHKDLVMVDFTKDNIAYDGMYVVRVDGVLKVKRANWGPGRKTVILTSDNAIQHPPTEHDAEGIDIIGRVVWISAKQY